MVSKRRHTEKEWLLENPIESSAVVILNACEGSPHTGEEMFRCTQHDVFSG